uniref:Uncharacterized protein n=1 Tax=Timema genevievae TaxID=629358 RepID=A0A7R9K7F7_TIMGE|nr:unnamed protein product [Timema genevievae]
MQQILGDEEGETLSLYSCSYPSADDKTGASSTPNVWENRLRFRKSLSCTERWVEASIQYTKVQTRPPSSACDEVGQEQELVLYPQSLENASTTKLSDIEPNQNTISEKSLCDNSTAPEDHPLGENGSILTPDSPIHVTTCLDQVSDKPLVYKTLKETDNQAELLKSDCFGSHLSREKLNHSNTEQPLIESILSPSSRKESVLAIYINKLRPYLSEAGDNDSEISVGIPSSRPIACKNSKKHKVGSSASLDNGNVQLKESSQKKEHLSLKRSNDASISSPCKKQKLVEEIEAQVSEEESTSPSRSSIDLNTSNVKMSGTNSPAVPKGRLNATLPPSEHPDVVSSKGNSPLISRRTNGNKCTLEREDPRNISFSPEEFIYSDSVCSKSAATSKCKNKHTDKTENSREDMIEKIKSSVFLNYMKSGPRNAHETYDGDSAPNVPKRKKRHCLVMDISDKGGKQSIEQNGSTGEEGEKSDHEISELLYQENRTKPCSPITAVSTNSQFFNIERKSNTHEKLSTNNVYKRQSEASFTTLGCEEETTPGTLPRSDTEMMDDNIEKRCLKEVLDSSSCISSHKQDCKELAGRKEKIHFEDKIDARHSSIFPSANESVSSKPQHQRQDLDDASKSCSKITYVNKSKSLGSLCEYSSSLTQKPTNRVKKSSIKSQSKTSTSQKENSQPTLVETSSNNETREHSSLLSESNNSGISEESISLDDSETWSDWCRRVESKALLAYLSYP